MGNILTEVDRVVLNAMLIQAPQAQMLASSLEKPIPPGFAARFNAT
jgi:hypothetical protein